MSEKKTCGFCRWVKLEEIKGFHPKATCDLPEGFLMDQRVPLTFGCVDFEPCGPIQAAPTSKEAEQ